MISAIVRRQLVQSARHTRCFSSTSIASAQEVKRLGVVGAGQMVLLPTIYPPTTFADQISGTGNSIGGGAKGGYSSHSCGYEPSFN
jgi:hypothetical protein